MCQHCFMPDQLWYLQQIKVFSVLTPAQLEIIKSHTFVQRAVRGAPIYLPGEPADSVYLLKEGTVRIARLSPNGDTTPMAILDKGDFFGELDVIEGSPRVEMAEAIGEVMLCIWPRERFHAMLQANPALHLEVTKSIGRRLRRIEEKVEDLVFLGATERLENLLRRLAREFGEPHPAGTRITVSLTHHEMARLIGVSRQTVSETLTALRKRGWLQLDGRRVVLQSVVAPH